MTTSEFEANARIVSGDPNWSLDDNAFKSFPPVSDTIVWFKQVDWREVSQRCKAGVNNCGLVIAVVAEKVHDFGVFLAQV